MRPLFVRGKPSLLDLRRFLTVSASTGASDASISRTFLAVRAWDLIQRFKLVFFYNTHNRQNKQNRPNHTNKQNMPTRMEMMQKMILTQICEWLLGTFGTERGVRIILCFDFGDGGRAPLLVLAWRRRGRRGQPRILARLCLGDRPIALFLYEYHDASYLSLPLPPPLPLDRSRIDVHGILKPHQVF
jgi:hypothetical protein